MTGRSSRVTRRGVWIDGVLLGCTDNGWRRWFTNHGDAESPDMSGLFHMCAEAPCRAKSSGASTAQVHISEFRVLTTKQAESLGYASEGLKALATELDGASLEEPAAATPAAGASPATDATDSADETAALKDVGAGASPGAPKAGTLGADLRRAFSAADAAAKRDATDAGMPGAWFAGSPRREP